MRQILDRAARDGARTLAVASVMLAVLGALRPAQAHEFYDPWCCNEQDCAPYPAEKVHVTPNGYWLPEFQEHVPFDKVRETPMHAPEPFHLCQFPKGHVRCFYAPSAGT